MHKFIPTHWNRNTHVLVTKYNWPIEEYLKGHAILVHINTLEDIPNILRNIHEATKIHGFIYEDEYASLETLDLSPQLGSSPIVLYINRMGQFRNIQHKIGLLKELNITIIFTGNEQQSVVDAQILASLGIHSGIRLNPDSALSDSVLDLITYDFYGTLPHGDIEPFSTIEKQYDGESIISPFVAEFVNPEQYIYVDKEMNLAFSQKQLDNKEFFDNGLDVIYNISSHNAIKVESCKWQEMFVAPHKCTFCPAFRICMGYFEKQNEKGRCKEVMSELLDAIEYKKKKMQQLNRRKGCQL